MRKESRLWWDKPDHQELRTSGGIQVLLTTWLIPSARWSMAVEVVKKCSKYQCKGDIFKNLLFWHYGQNYQCYQKHQAFREHSTFYLFFFGDPTSSTQWSLTWMGGGLPFSHSVYISLNTVWFSIIMKHNDLTVKVQHNLITLILINTVITIMWLEFLHSLLLLVLLSFQCASGCMTMWVPVPSSLSMSSSSSRVPSLPAPPQRLPPLFHPHHETKEESRWV